jgi:protein-S-isoprenylcysteine O-methyltransferase Ste14
MWKFLYALLFVALIPAALVLWSLRLEPMVALPGPHWPAPGLALAAIGALLIGLAWQALWVHGRGLPMNAFPPPLYVTRGIYGWLGHPIYVGFVLICAGVSLAAGSAAGLWMVTPLTALGAAALVLGHELHDLRRRIGAATIAASARNRRLRLPAGDSARPARWDLLSTYVLLFLPWLILYEAIGHVHTSDVLSIRMMAEWNWRVMEWTELPYAAVYPFALLAPLALRTRARLRRFIIAGWVGTTLGMLSYLILPLIAEPLPFEPETALGLLLMLERSDGLAGRAAFPAFHIFWAFMGAWAIASRGRRAAAAAWAFAILSAVACFTTGQHAIADIPAGAALFAIALTSPRWWRTLERDAERIANSWREWRIGPVRVISHALYAGAGAASGVCLLIALVGPAAIVPAAIIALSALVGGALWGQLLVGSRTLLRPFGYYGSALGGLAGLGLLALLAPADADLWRLAAAGAVAAPWIQAVGRLRCLVQGCCHGAPVGSTDAPRGIRYFHPRSRAVHIARLAGVRVHATPLYSLLGNIVIGLFLLRLWRLGIPPTLIAGLYLILAGLARFVEESFRGEPQTPIKAGLRLYQWCAIASIVAGMAVMSIRTEYFVPTLLWLDWRLLVAGLITGAVYAAAMGVDFPGSDRPFARLV